MPKKAENSQTNTELSRSKVVKTCPIVKDNKWYKVGEKFPYNPATDKKLLWNLEDISENKNKGK